MSVLQMIVPAIMAAALCGKPNAGAEAQLEAASPPPIVQTCPNADRKAGRGDPDAGRFFFRLPRNWRDPVRKLV